MSRGLADFSLVAESARCCSISVAAANEPVEIVKGNWASIPDTNAPRCFGLTARLPRGPAIAGRRVVSMWKRQATFSSPFPSSCRPLFKLSRAFRGVDLPRKRNEEKRGEIVRMFYE